MILFGSEEKNHTFFGKNSSYQDLTNLEDDAIMPLKVAERVI